MKPSCATPAPKWASWLSTAFIVLVLTGCVSVGPDYVSPSPPVGPTWHTQLKGGLTSNETDPTTMAAWWTTLNAPELSQLIDRAVSGNLDLKKARARVREARARRGVARADLVPAVDATGSTTRSRGSESMGSGDSTTLYRTGFDATWELDIFGGLRRSMEAAEADLQASQEDLRDVLVSLLGEVASNYVEVRTLQLQLAVAEANILAQRDTYQLAAWRQEAGLSDQLAVQQARYNLESTQSKIPIIRTSLEETMNRIAVLLGDPPGRVHGDLEKPMAIPSIPLSVAVGVPANALRRRPDVRRAERELAAQTARVGVATADLYPKFTLSGSIGLEALALNKLFFWSNRTTSGGGGISLPIFHGGALRQKVEIQSALQEQAAIVYEATVLNAFEEVENILTAYAEQQARRDSLRAAEDAARQAAEMAQHKYEAGLADFISVLDAQRQLLSFQEQLAESNGAVVSNLIKLYKALGGGWESLIPQGEK
ncbi:MAG: Toluene efflux pump outer membrane protein TtgI precursor [Syntrophorhabdus sp. PtaB.Bin006]|nr:MAG: Toluene efflux pump outer membrane protein TtgI precursor [Syntrophorhabdus sp. PtaB.Bin006]